MLPLFVRSGPATVGHPLYRRVASRVTPDWAPAELAVTTREGLALSRTTAVEFIWLRTAVEWPVMARRGVSLVSYLRWPLDPLHHRLAARTPKDEPLMGDDDLIGRFAHVGIDEPDEDHGHADGHELSHDEARHRPWGDTGEGVREHPSHGDGRVGEAG